MTPATSPAFTLSRNAFGRLVCTLADGGVHVGVLPVRAFPLTAPDDGLSLVSGDGRELVWVPSLAALPADQRALVDEELAQREFVPQIRRILGVSTFSTPSTWQLETDRGPAELVLQAEEDIRRLPGARAALLITSGHGVVFRVPDLRALDRHSRRLIERFL
jgi:hypothetical protein